MDNATAASDNGTVSGYTSSFGISLAIASVASSLLVILKEKSPAALAWMKKATGHHWATHSLFAIVIFVGLGLVLARANGGKGLQVSAKSLVTIVVGGVAVGLALILGFYLISG